jgi:peptidoglycan hydrolase-like amidase
MFKRLLILFLLFTFSLGFAKERDIRVGLFLNKKEISVYAKQKIYIYGRKRKIFTIRPKTKVKIWIGKGNGNNERKTKENLWYLQAGAFKKQKSVDQCIKRLEKLTGVSVIVTSTKNSKFKLVKVGPFTNLSDATAVKDVLKMNGFPDVFISTPPKGSVSGYGIYLVTKNYDKFFLSKSKIKLVCNSPIKVNGAYFRGTMEVNKYGSKINVINTVSLQDYLKGVVPAEMSPSLYPSLEAIKAQTVAARTYVFYNLNQFKKMGFDICATQSCQVYKGVAVEHPMSDKAVSQTKGEIITYDGKPINALFTAYCGGHTEDVENVFSGGAVPYLKGVVCGGGKDKFVTTTVKGTFALETLVSPYDDNPPLAVSYLFAKGIITKSDILKLNNQLTSETALPILARLSEYLGLQGENTPVEIESLKDVLNYLALDLFDSDDKTVLFKGGLVNQKVDGLKGRLIDVACICYSVLKKFYSVENYGYKRKILQKEDLQNLNEAEFVFIKQGSVEVSVPSVGLRLGERVKLLQQHDKIIGLIVMNEESQTNVNDSFLNSYNWYSYLPVEKLSLQVNKYGNFGKIKDINVLQKSATGRVTAIRVIGTVATKKFTGLRVRWVLGVKENKFNLYKMKDRNGNFKGVYIVGTAWGHGVGMCQIGAFGLALKGYNYKEILKHYYQGVEIEKREF